MKHWDSSALVPLLLEEPATASITALFRSDPVQIVWWGSPVECTSALARLEREGSLSPATVTEALARLKELSIAWHEVQPGEDVRETANRFLRVHPLRAADALQLASAFVAAEGRPASLEFVTLDERLGLAASREGFPVRGA